MEGKSLEGEKEKEDKKKRAYWRVDCQSASKGRSRLGEVIFYLGGRHLLEVFKTYFGRSGGSYWKG